MKDKLLDENWCFFVIRELTLKWATIRELVLIREMTTRQELELTFGHQTKIGLQLATIQELVLRKGYQTETGF